VTYWEPAKWAARLRRETTSGRPVLLKINMDAGHQGAAGRFESLRETALEYAFAIEAARPGGFAGAQ
jgi:oligopeptidase B